MSPYANILFPLTLLLGVSLGFLLNIWWHDRKD